MSDRIGMSEDWLPVVCSLFFFLPPIFSFSCPNSSRSSFVTLPRYLFKSHLHRGGCPHENRRWRPLAIMAKYGNPSHVTDFDGPPGGELLHTRKVESILAHGADVETILVGHCSLHSHTSLWSSRPGRGLMRINLLFDRCRVLTHTPRWSDPLSRRAHDASSIYA